jgi:hypothetical protein
MTYEGDPEHGYRVYVMDRDSTMCLISGYDANARMRIIKRWQALEAEVATPAFRLEPTPDTSYNPAVNIAALKLSCTAMRAARAFGLKGNHAALSADRAVRAITGTSALALLGQSHLVADSRGQTYTPTELGKMLFDPISARKLNKLLGDQAFQVHDIKGAWVPTTAARAHCEWLDTGKRHSDGTPVKQLKWFTSVLDALGLVYQCSDHAVSES